MSKRKQAAIKAAKQAAAQQEQKANIKSLGKTSLFQQLKSPAVLASVGIGMLLSLGVIGATVGNDKNNAWLNTFSASLLSAQPASANPPAVNPLPTPAPTPQLSKEYLYAGSKMLAVEDANAPSNSNQPADLVVWRNSNGTWYVMDSDDPNNQTGAVWGQAGDIPKPADFDGDGLYDFCVYRPNYPSGGLGTFFIQPNNGGTFFSSQFGVSSDVPVPADYDGDGRADVAVYRPSNNTYYVLNSSNNAVQSLAIGQASSTPLPADYDGDGKVDPAVYKLLSNNTYEWTIYKSTSGQLAPIFPYGDVPNGDVPATGDFNGDGVFDVAVRRVGTNEWIIRNVGAISMNLSGFTMQSADVPVAGDYDGDGKTDAAVWRPSTGTWYIRQSKFEGHSNQMRVQQWGASTDTPVPAPFRR